MIHKVEVAQHVATLSMPCSINSVTGWPSFYGDLHQEHDASDGLTVTHADLSRPGDTPSVE